MTSEEGHEPTSPTKDTQEANAKESEDDMDEEQTDESKPKDDIEADKPTDEADEDKHDAVKEEDDNEKENKDTKDDSSDLQNDDMLAPVTEPEVVDPKIQAELDLVANSSPTTELEMALYETLKRKDAHIERLSGEVHKLKAFISKRKQTYKRKRKDEGAPTRALSAYNIFVQDRFAQLAKENEAALKSTDSEAQLKRVPPANLVASTGNQWKELSAEEKAKYEERAKADRKRYEDQMAQYQPPDKQANRKRNKTGYNMFFSAHVLRLKQSETGVPSERGSVARLVGTAWKQLSAEEKQYYEREADKHNGANPVKDEGDEDEDEQKQQQMTDPYAHMHVGHDGMHMHGGMPPPMHGGGMHQPPQHDPRHHAYAPYPTHHMYGQPPAYYDYSQHHTRHQQGRSQGYGQGYPPPQRHPYDNSGMNI